MSGIVHAGSYKVFIGNDIFLHLEKFLGSEYPRAKKIIITDANVAETCLPIIKERVQSLKDSAVIIIPAGEASKSISCCESIWTKLHEYGVDRQSLIINLGGGVVCDVGGFSASVFLRGVNFVNIPTSLLAMVDSSIGGKTGINFLGVKNQIGTFRKPSGVFISPVWLKSLPDIEKRSGFAEMIKHALITGNEKLELLFDINIFDNINWIPFIQDAVFIKNKIVSADFRDRHQRKTLNFGHTIGHALESYSHKHQDNPLRHGEAVALGIAGELFLSKTVHGFPEDTLLTILELLKRYYHKPEFEFDDQELLTLMKSDKKNENSSINFVLLKNVGDPVINNHIGDDLIKNSLSFIRGFNKILS